MNAQVATLIKEANSLNAVISANASLALALHPSTTPAEVLVELHRVAVWFNLENLMNALLDNRNLPVSALASMDVQYA